MMGKMLLLLFRRASRATVVSHFEYSLIRVRMEGSILGALANCRWCLFEPRHDQLYISVTGLMSLVCSFEQPYASHIAPKINKDSNLESDGKDTNTWIMCKWIVSAE